MAETPNDPQTPQPGLEPGPGRKMRVAAVGDLHVGETSQRAYRDLFERVADDADVLCLCGDLTNYGKTGEVERLLEDLRLCRIPMVGVLGNHEHECGQPDHVVQMLCDAGVKMLTGQAYEIDGVGFAGGKGFVGGFGRYMLSSFGEDSIKRFVQEAVEDANLIENSIRMLRTERSVVLLHYAPVVETVIGEPPEIHAFLGSSRLAETIDRYDNVSLVVHGHAHRGGPEGRTHRGVPVYNVALPVLRTLGDLPYRVFEV
ncbi:MAG: metallophosphoesterase [Brevundimonas sp.]|uniref:Metallophosphoesterase n=1 Tax=Brevundimonas albigilva TaxID=1312364 RepID=A0ABY4SM35_9CAUL|nr:MULTISPECIES: metallophosphoesterase [Brevundimonas]PZU59250.1 MAG: metallophosphoesterase [Brevundimonas sp.]UQV17255.1 metallophosphoesterase [Brevundimonas albigilva]URI14916.1 metallophosphoesterase [Brevundimonas albigilva]